MEVEEEEEEGQPRKSLPPQQGGAPAPEPEGPRMVTRLMLPMENINSALRLLFGDVRLSSGACSVRVLACTRVRVLTCARARCAGARVLH